MPRILTFTHGPESWRALLADPDKHWKTGYSARTLAHAWEAADGFPPEVAAALGRATAPELASLQPVLATPEYKVPLPGGRRASQNDIFVLAKSAAGPVAIMVEGKVNESFGPKLDEWQAEASEGKEVRLAYLLEVLGLKTLPSETRYQLLHRTASALIAAEQYRAAAAVMLVHSFSAARTGFADYQAFLALFGAAAAFGEVTSLGKCRDIPLFAAWVPGDPAFLER